MNPNAPTVPDHGDVADAGGLDPGALFDGLSGSRGLVLAVSGGPDSTALMWLVARWRGRPPVLAVSVDHGLRPESAAEADLAAANAERLGLPSRVMRAQARAASGNLQDWARRQRYALLTAAALAAKCDTIVTAHHLDDQAETFLLRLARGSGVYGLAAMSKVAQAGGLRIAHPLLDVPGATLRAIAAGSGFPLVADPSNADRRFDRVRMRGLMPALADVGLTAPRLAGTAAAMRRAASALDHYAQALIRAHFHADPAGAVAGHAAALREAPEEVGLRVLALILKAVGGADVTPPLDGLLGLRAAIAGGGGGDPGVRLKRTLHGAVVSLAGKELRVMREWGRKGPSSLGVRAGEPAIWDARFKIAVPASSPGRSDLSVGPLGRATRRLRSRDFGAATLRLLPGLFAGAALAAVPRSVFAADDGEALDALCAECLVGPKLGLGPGFARAAAPRSP